MTPAQLALLIEADNRFHDPDRAKTEVQPNTQRLEHMLAARGLVPGIPG